MCDSSLGEGGGRGLMSNSLALVGKTPPCYYTGQRPPSKGGIYSLSPFLLRQRLFQLFNQDLPIHWVAGF
jgi:hypothetical protein